MTDFRPDDRATLTVTVGNTKPHPKSPVAGCVFVRLEGNDGGFWVRPENLTLVERGKRELRAGDRIVGKDGSELIWTGDDLRDAGWYCSVGGGRQWISGRIYTRGAVDDFPDGWHFYPTPTEPEGSR